MGEKNCWHCEREGSLIRGRGGKGEEKKIKRLKTHVGDYTKNCSPKPMTGEKERVERRV